MHRSKHLLVARRPFPALSTLLLPVFLALPPAAEATGSCNSNSCSGHADAILTSVKMDNTTGDVMLNIASAARSSITSCTLATGGYARLSRNHPAFAALYPTMLQAIATGQWVGVVFQSGSGCYVSSFSAVSTQISSPATGGGGSGGGGCSMYGCTQ
jgi:hypothetical protein